MKWIVAFGIGLFASKAFAQGGPPLITDDPGTVEKGKWELNLAWIHRSLPQSIENELPHFDMNRGISDKAHLKLEVPWVFSSSGHSSIDGDGGGSVGLKYRFIDGDGARPAISTYPQFGFSIEPRSVRLGLADSGTSVLLPIEIQWDLKGYSINEDSGLVFQPGGPPGWIEGVAFGKEIRGTEVLAEIHGQGVFATGEENWIAQLGLRRDLSEHSTLLFAFGRTVASHNSESLSWTSYFGVQLRF